MLPTIIFTACIAFGAGWFCGAVTWCLFDSAKVYEQAAKHEHAKRGVDYRELD